MISGLLIDKNRKLELVAMLYCYDSKPSERMYETYGAIGGNFG